MMHSRPLADSPGNWKPEVGEAVKVSGFFCGVEGGKISREMISEFIANKVKSQ